jgi:uncharacterized protein DUF6883
MKLPNAERAIVRPGKVTDYLLSESHPTGRHKARFFQGMGFSLTDWKQLEAAVIGHAVQHEVSGVRETPFGHAYSIDGPLTTPSGKSPNVRTGWFREKGQSAPYFVTAYPLEETR